MRISDWSSDVCSSDLILKLSARQVEIGGNLGTPALTLEPLDQGGIYVLEMSSYQLELTLSITFDIAVLMNITPDHIDRHGGFDGYVKAKRQIFHRQTKPRTPIVGVDAPTRGGISRSDRHTSEPQS